ncbi:hypothetical protein RvY_07436-3 [Ramazzottius varieornatus]|uniref:Uncharacterized protein n=1 Tax=Ramazzottius varieornatus TaxID=947166 RepID=A0A1D1VBN0_RAMVA|nr:hypothetical protein RvY_07436-3 [Ramazzottius varieornatus]
MAVLGSCFCLSAHQVTHHRLPLFFNFDYELMIDSCRVFTPNLFPMPTRTKQPLPLPFSSPLEVFFSYWPLRLVLKLAGVEEWHWSTVPWAYLLGSCLVTLGRLSHFYHRLDGNTIDTIL